MPRGRPGCAFPGTYSGKRAAETNDLIIARKRDLKRLMHTVKGFADYSVVKTEDGGFTITVSRSEKASDAITAAARDCENGGAKLDHGSGGIVLLRAV